jgi:hypothetical protein
MTYKQGFLTMFNLLDNFYFEDTSNDDLANILSNMNPSIFADGEPADPAYWADWERILEEKSIKEPMNTDELLNGICAFLEFYQKEFEFNLKSVLEKVEGLSSESEILIKYINQVKAK